MTEPNLYSKSQPRLLVMCSSKGRPEKLNDMIDSVLANKSEGTELVVYVSEDDPKLTQYRPVLERVPYVIGPSRNMVQVLNFFAIEVFPNVPFYTDLNDDQYVITKGWDELLIQSCQANNAGWCMAGVRSPLSLPYAVVIPGKMVRALGYYFPPNFVHTWIDNVLKEYEKFGMLVYRNDVVVEHRHPCFGTPPDETFSKWSATQSQFDIGHFAFEEWIREHRDRDLAQLFSAKAKGKQ